LMLRRHRYCSNHEGFARAVVRRFMVRQAHHEGNNGGAFSVRL
jgi:hypothetical protein